LEVGELLLVIGGVRSGKSAFAERLASAANRPVAYLATGEAGDAEMSVRIAKHRARRPAAWLTVEAPLEPATALRRLDSEMVVLIDCIGLLVSNHLLREADAEAAARRVVEAVGALVDAAVERAAPTVVVTAEVGLSLVSVTSLGRRFQDVLGEVNQRLAAAAGTVYLVVAGIGLRLDATIGPNPEITG
jgi:adenosylcobinamide kinase/adenosylcobinamide-phosphate guanylyltransferase